MGCASSQAAPASRVVPHGSAPVSDAAPAAAPAHVAADVYHVFDSGEVAVNGTYRKSGSHDGAPVYVHESGNYRILRYRFKTGQAYWFITTWDLKRATSSQDDVYRTSRTDAPRPPAVWYDAVSLAGKKPTVHGKTAPKVRPATTPVDAAPAEQELGSWSCTVKGAGEHVTNGLYFESGCFDGVPQYINDHGITLLRYRFSSGRAFWFFSDRDKGGNAAKDRDLYRTSAPSEEVRPLGTWIAAPSSKPTVVGKGPTPTITWQRTGDAGEEAQEDGDKLDANAAADMSYPSYWTTPSSVEPGSSFAKQLAPRKVIWSEVESLLKQTFTGKRTRDRKGRAMPTSLTLRNLQRVENSSAWNRYAARRAHLLRRESECRSLEALYGGAPVLTSGFEGQELSQRLLPNINEFYLWHGTKPSAALSIVTEGFQINRAGLTNGAMFGKGAYFAEASSKADEYAEDEDDGLYAGLFAMLLCRVCCGRIHRVLRPNDDEINRLLAAGEIDSVLGDREGAVGTYREFVVFDVAQVYPEYVFVYAREYDEEE